jgi:hypothetical protein
MWFFGKKHQLIRALDSLAIYNEKGIDWSRHTPEQTVAERLSRLAKIQVIAATLGRDALPQEFMSALDSGEVASDGTGRYVELVKDHFNRG